MTSPDPIVLPGYPPQPRYWICYACGEEHNWIFRRACQRCRSPRSNGC